MSSRAPQLNNPVVLSLEALLEEQKPADYLGTEKEAGIKYITALVQHYRSPENTAKRQRDIERATAHQRGRAS